MRILGKEPHGPANPSGPRRLRRNESVPKTHPLNYEGGPGRVIKQSGWVPHRVQECGLDFYAFSFAALLRTRDLHFLTFSCYRHQHPRSGNGDSNDCNIWSAKKVLEKIRWSGS